MGGPNLGKGVEFVGLAGNKDGVKPPGTGKLVGVMIAEQPAK